MGPTPSPSFKRALELDTTLHEAAAALSDAYAGRGDGGDELEALEWMERAVAKLPIAEANAGTRMTYARKLASLYADRGDPQEAVAILTSLSPGMLYSPGVSRDLAGYYEDAGPAAAGRGALRGRAAGTPRRCRRRGDGGAGTTSKAATPPPPAP